MSSTASWKPAGWEDLPLSRASISRAAHRRTEPGLIAQLRGRQSTRVVLVRGADVAVESSGDRLVQFPASVFDDVGPSAPGDTGLPGRQGSPWEAGAALPELLWFFLGEDDDGAFLALTVPLAGEHVGIEGFEAPSAAMPAQLWELVRHQTWAPLRDVGQDLAVADAGLATTAVALAAWHSTHTRCPRCGEPTEVEAGGWVRRCPADGTEHYPRTDPAVIMAVIDEDDRLLLGHARHWPEGRFSTLAGYVEPGEGLEAAVRREVLEECAVEVGEVEYRGSQPWPFPASLMFGFSARALTTAIRVDGDEVTDARWFTRADLAEAVRTGSVLLPMGTSIARALIEDWFGGPLSAEL